MIDDALDPGGAGDCGYTEFIRNRDVSLMRAEQIIADLFGAVVDSAEHPLTLNKFEGDALLQPFNASP